MATILRVKKDVNIYIEDSTSSPTYIYIDDMYVVSLSYDPTNLEVSASLKYIGLLNGTDTTGRADPATATDCTVYTGDKKQSIVPIIMSLLGY